MTREENLTLLKMSIEFFVDLFIYNISNIDMVNTMIENKDEFIKQFADALLHNKCLVSQLKRELSNIEYDVEETRKAENEN